MERLREGFDRIRREHVEQACREFLRRGPPRGGGAYFICFEAKELPAKLILKEAYKLANDREISSSRFSGGIYTARILEGLKFEVVVRSKSEG
jgi:hypothetical protein